MTTTNIPTIIAERYSHLAVYDRDAGEWRWYDERTIAEHATVGLLYARMAAHVSLAEACEVASAQLRVAMERGTQEAQRKGHARHELRWLTAPGAEGLEAALAALNARAG